MSPTPKQNSSSYRSLPSCLIVALFLFQTIAHAQMNETSKPGNVIINTQNIRKLYILDEQDNCLNFDSFDNPLSLPVGKYKASVLILDDYFRIFPEKEFALKSGEITTLDLNCTLSGKIKAQRIGNALLHISYELFDPEGNRCYGSHKNLPGFEVYMGDIRIGSGAFDNC